MLRRNRIRAESANFYPYNRPSIVVTSAPEMFLPDVTDFIVMLLDEILCCSDLSSGHTEILRQLNCRIERFDDPVLAFHE